MEKLDNGKYRIGCSEFYGDDYTNLNLAECPCGWRKIDNQFAAYRAFQEHECLTKAGKPRKKKLDGRMRAATFDEVFEEEA